MESQLLQKDFSLEFLSLCKRNGINTAVETNLSMDMNDTVKRFLPVVDYWMCDLKMLDSQKHEYWTGVKNSVILDNIKNFGENGFPLTVRTPVIPGVNDSVEDIEDICRFLFPYNKTIKYELLGFHTLGFEKFSSLGIKNELENKESLSVDRLNMLKKVLQKYKF